jgi:hypothetical protein
MPCSMMDMFKSNFSYPLASFILVSDFILKIQVHAVIQGEMLLMGTHSRSLLVAVYVCVCGHLDLVSLKCLQLGVTTLLSASQFLHYLH